MVIPGFFIPDPTIGYHHHGTRNIPCLGKGHWHPHDDFPEFTLRHQNLKPRALPRLTRFSNGNSGVSQSRGIRNKPKPVPVTKLRIRIFFLFHREECPCHYPHRLGKRDSPVFCAKPHFCQR